MSTPMIGSAGYGPTNAYSYTTSYSTTPQESTVFKEEDNTGTTLAIGGTLLAAGTTAYALYKGKAGGADNVFKMLGDGFKAIFKGGFSGIGDDLGKAYTAAKDGIKGILAKTDNKVTPTSAQNVDTVAKVNTDTFTRKVPNLDETVAAVKKGDISASQAKETLTQNLTKTQKKQVKEQVDVAAQEARNVQKQINTEVSSNLTKTKVADGMQNSSKHIKNATSEELPSIVENAQTTATSAKQAAEQIEAVAKNNPNSSSLQKSATMARNNANAAQAEADKIKSLADTRGQQIIADDASKAQAREITAARTPEQLQKQELNGQKALDNSIKRNNSKESKQVESYLSELTRKYRSSDNLATLEKMLNSPKYTDIQKQAVQMRIDELLLM